MHADIEPLNVGAAQAAEEVELRIQKDEETAAAAVVLGVVRREGSCSTSRRQWLHFGGKQCADGPLHKGPHSLLGRPMAGVVDVNDFVRLHIDAENLSGLR